MAPVPDEPDRELRRYASANIFHMLVPCLQGVGRRDPYAVDEKIARFDAARLTAALRVLTLRVPREVAISEAYELRHTDVADR